MAFLLFVDKPRSLQSNDAYSYTLVLSDIFGAICLVLLLFIFTMSVRILKVPKEILEHPVIKKRYGVLYLNSKLDNLWQRLITFLFVFRRTSACLICLYLSHALWLQIQLTLLQNLLFIIHAGTSRPYASRAENRKELANELFIISMSTTLILFSDFARDSSFQYNVAGWMYILLLGLCLLFNLSFLFVYVIKLLKLIIIKYGRRIIRQFSIRF